MHKKTRKAQGLVCRIPLYQLVKITCIQTFIVTIPFKPTNKILSLTFIKMQIQNRYFRVQWLDSDSLKISNILSLYISFMWFFYFVFVVLCFLYYYFCFVFVFCLFVCFVFWGEQTSFIKWSHVDIKSKSVCFISLICFLF